MSIEIIIDGTTKSVTKKELFDLAKQGKINSNTPISVNGKQATAGKVKGIEFGLGLVALNETEWERVGQEMQKLEQERLKKQETIVSVQTILPVPVPLPIPHRPPPYMSNPQPTVAPVASTSGNSDLWKTKRNCNTAGWILCLIGAGLFFTGGQLKIKNLHLLEEVITAEEEYNILTSGGQGIRQGVFDDYSLEKQMRIMSENFKIINQYQKKIDDAQRKFNAESYPPDAITFLKGGGVVSFILGIVLQIVGFVIHVERPKEATEVTWKAIVEIMWCTIIAAVGGGVKFQSLQGAGIGACLGFVIGIAFRLMGIPVFFSPESAKKRYNGWFWAMLCSVLFALIMSLVAVISNWSVYRPEEAWGIGVCVLVLTFLGSFLFVGLPIVGICYLLRIGR